MKAFVWLSFDLGVRGDFQGMYEFLDEQQAKECGDSLAAFNFEYKKDLLAELTKRLKDKVELNKRSRVYVMYPKEGKTSGRFIIGKRKAPPWTGYAALPGNQEEDEG
jgi:hypothetical protein